MVIQITDKQNLTCEEEASFQRPNRNLLTHQAASKSHNGYKLRQGNCIINITNISYHQYIQYVLIFSNKVSDLIIIKEKKLRVSGH